MNSSDHRNKRQICLYFQVHQPRRLTHFRFFDIDTTTCYFNDQMNYSVLQKGATHCYLPANQLILRLIRAFPDIKVTFSLSGLVLEQLELYAPEVTDSFRMLAETGSVEFLSETYYHSLSFLAGRHEFETQVAQHRDIIERLLGVRPKVFRNTELIYADNLGRILEDMGFKGALLDGAEATIGSRNPNQLYAGYGAPNLKLLLRNYRLSDDIAFRYGNTKWGEWPLTAAKYVNWLEKLPASDKVVTIGMDYETFGEHHPARTGIFRFLEELLRRLQESKKLSMATPSEIFARMKPVTYLPVPHYSSWADNERDLSAWLGNDIQKDAFESLLGLQTLVYEIKSPELLHQWRLLQTSDHFYYMSTKRYSDGMVHAHFSPYASPYEAFMNFMNVITDLRLKLERYPKPASKGEEPARRPVKSGKSIRRKQQAARSQATV